MAHRLYFSCGGKIKFPIKPYEPTLHEYIQNMAIREAYVHDIKVGDISSYFRPLGLFTYYIVEQLKLNLNCPIIDRKNITPINIFYSEIVGKCSYLDVSQSKTNLYNIILKYREIGNILHWNIRQLTHKF